MEEDFLFKSVWAWCVVQEHQKEFQLLRILITKSDELIITSGKMNGSMKENMELEQTVIIPTISTNEITEERYFETLNGGPIQGN